MAGYTRLRKFVANGEPVEAGVVNRAPRTLAEQIDYLKALIEAASLGSTVFLREQTIEPDAKPGQPVYFNAATQRFERGLAQMTSDVVTGRVDIGDASHIWGVVYTKANATLADILVHGCVRDLSLTDALESGQTRKSGLYFLSSSTPGKLTRTRPSIPVPVMRVAGDFVFVNPGWIDLLSNHSHLAFELACVPLGIHASVDNVHTITEPFDTTVPGWLPADHTSFDGKAPPGAVFGYNLAADARLKDAWPPIPPGDASLVWDKGVSADDAGMEIPLGNAGLAIVDRNGVWWMSNCLGDVPWPQAFETGTSDSYSDSSDAECPRHLQMRLRMYFTRLAFFTDQSVVTSCRTLDNRLIIECEGKPGTAATVGPLTFRLDLRFLVGDTDSEATEAFKTFDPDTQTFTLGPVATGVYSKSGNLLLSGEKVRSKNIGDVLRAVYYGAVGIEAVDPTERELEVSLTRVGNGGVEERYTEDEVMYLAFVAGRTSEYRARIVVPLSLAVANPQMKLRIRLIGTAAGTLPAMTLTARRIPATVLGTPVALPTTDGAVTFTTGVAVTADQYVDLESAAFAVAAGDDVLFTLRRTSGDGYSGEVGVLRHGGIVLAS